MNDHSYHISLSSQIENNTASINGQQFHQSNQEKATDFFKEIYKKLGMRYPKYHKMDPLCKLALLAFESMHQTQAFTEKYQPEEIALVFFNRHASLHTDIQHQKSIENSDNYFPSPAVFVYTLANIMLGEIAIRYKIKGENACFVSENFEVDHFYDYCSALLEKGNTKCIVGGWVDFFENNYSTHLLCIENQEYSAPYRSFDKSSLNNLFIKEK